MWKDTLQIKKWKKIYFPNHALKVFVLAPQISLVLQEKSFFLSSWLVHCSLSKNEAAVYFGSSDYNRQFTLPIHSSFQDNMIFLSIIFLFLIVLLKTILSFQILLILKPMKLPADSSCFNSFSCLSSVGSTLAWLLKKYLLNLVLHVNNIFSLNPLSFKISIIIYFSSTHSIESAKYGICKEKRFLKA